LAAFQVPSLTGPVVDEANILSHSAETRLDQAIRALQKQGGSQLQVLTVPSLEGETIEQASIKVTDVWKLGTKEGDRGVLLMVARDDRAVRIEVGQGNEGVLTDIQSKRIIEESITPLFRQGDFDGGVTLGVYQISRATDPGIDLASYLEGQRTKNQRSRGGPVNGWFPLLFLLFILLNFLFGGGGRGRRLGRRSGIYYGSLGGGGGSWGGGGGGFSGGGASGRW
jgi:uncharacterized protein